MDNETKATWTTEEIEKILTIENIHRHGSWPLNLLLISVLLAGLLVGMTVRSLPQIIGCIFGH